MSRSPQIRDIREAIRSGHETPDERRGIEDFTLTVSRAPETDTQAGDSQAQELHLAERERGRNRVEYRDRNRTYRLRDSEIATLAQIGVFRTINDENLAKYAYEGNQARMESDLRNLSKQSLIERHTLAGFRGDTPTIVTLTRNGQMLLRHSRVLPSDQVTYHGFRKTKEARHDAELYRLYQKVASEIVRKGGKNLRVSLDFELRKNLYHDLARLGPERNDPEKKDAIAARHGLQVVGNKIPVPDMRIEYDTPTSNGPKSTSSLPPRTTTRAT